MQEIVGIRFKKIGKIYFFDANGISLKKGQNAIVETARGIELGEVAIENRNIDENKVVSPLKPVIRVATSDDEKKYKENEINGNMFNSLFTRITIFYNYYNGYSII